MTEVCPKKKGQLLIQSSSSIFGAKVVCGSELYVYRPDLLPIENKHVFIRVDFNVPLTDKGEISDDTRIREALPTIRYAREKRAKVILASHFGRPKGKADPSLSLKPVAERLGERPRIPVLLARDCIGPEVKLHIDRLSSGEVILLENLRFHSEEEKNDPAFAGALAELAEVYVNDAFGSSHRAHASVVGMVSHFNTKGIGFLMHKEIAALSRLREAPAKPFVVILGGAKVSDKLGLIRGLLSTANTIVIGGAMAYTLQLAQGVSVGKSLVEANKVTEIRELLDEASRRGVTVLLPEDHVVVPVMQPEGLYVTTPGQQIPEDRVGVDIGRRTIESFSSAIGSAGTIFWNGPMECSKGRLSIVVRKPWPRLLRERKHSALPEAAIQLLHCSRLGWQQN